MSRSLLLGCEGKDLSVKGATGIDAAEAHCYLCMENF